MVQIAGDRENVLIFPTLRDKFDTKGVSVAAAVRVMAYFTDGEAKEVLSEKFVLV